MRQGLTYDNVLLEPQYSDIVSRKEVNLKTDLGKGVKLRLPIIASPMDTVSESNIAWGMGMAGATAIVHSIGLQVVLSVLVGTWQNEPPHSSTLAQKSSVLMLLTVITFLSKRL